MRNRFAWIAAVVTQIISAPNVALSETIDLFYTTEMDGTRYVYQVEAETIEATPAWSPESEPPPLSIARAIAIAKANLTDIPDDTELVLGDLWVKSIRGRSKTRWYYAVSFDIEGEWSKPFLRREVVVLFDGSVVERKVENASDNGADWGRSTPTPPEEWFDDAYDRLLMGTYTGATQSGCNLALEVFAQGRAQITTNCTLGDGIEPGIHPASWIFRSGQLEVNASGRTASFHYMEEPPDQRFGGRGSAAGLNYLRPTEPGTWIARFGLLRKSTSPTRQTEGD